MKTSSYSAGKVVKNFEKFFDKTVIKKLSRASGFVKRKPKKITAFAFVAGFIECWSKGVNSYSFWASCISTITGKVVSKQALFDRMNKESVEFAKELFSKAMKDKLVPMVESRLFKTFNRVLLQDSTTLSLPQCLSQHYAGNKSKGQQKAVARLQCIIDIVRMQWHYLSLDSFTNNDQSAAKIVSSLLRKGDLLIRDLGYFVLESLQQVINQKAFFISRLRYGITLYDEHGKVINWKTLCRRKTIVDRQVWIGKNHKVPVRIIFIPLPQTQVSEKVRKARNDRDKRLNHSPEYYQWIRYNVFVTNVEASILNTAEVSEAYKVRWQIEIIFKSWKSGFELQKILHAGCTKIERVNTIIYLLLMYICMTMQKIYVKHYKQIKNKHGRKLSLLKFAKYVFKNLLLLLGSSTSYVRQQLVTHCCYDLRNDRKNMTDFIMDF